MVRFNFIHKLNADEAWKGKDRMGFGREILRKSEGEFVKAFIGSFGRSSALGAEIETILRLRTEIIAVIVKRIKLLIGWKS